MKNKKKLIHYLILLFLTITTATSVYSVINLRGKLQQADNSLIINRKLSTLTITTFKKRIKNNKGISFIYIGNGSCSDCSVFTPILLRSLTKRGMLEYIFYVDAEGLHKDKKDWLNFKKRYDFDQTPCLMLFEDGKRISKLEWSTKYGITEKKLNNWLSKYRTIIKSTDF